MRRTIFIVLLAITSLLLPTSGATAQQQPRLEQAIQIYWTANTYDELNEMFPLLEQVIDNNPQSVRASSYYCLGALAFDEMEVAADWCSEAVAMNPQSGLAVAANSVLLAYQGNIEQAVTQANRAVELAPNNWVTQYLLAEVLYEAGRYQQTLTALERAIELGTTSPFPYAFAGEILFYEMETVERALTYYDRGLNAFPNSGDLLYGRGLVHLDMGNLAQAEADFSQLLTVDETAVNALVHLGKIYRRMGNESDSIDAYYEWLAFWYEVIEEEPEIGQIDYDDIAVGASLTLQMQVDTTAVHSIPVQLQRGQPVTITARVTSGATDPILYLFGPDTDLITVNDNVRPNDTSVATINFSPQQSGVHFIQVTHSVSYEDGVIELTVRRGN